MLWISLNKETADPGICSAFDLGPMGTSQKVFLDRVRLSQNLVAMSFPRSFVRSADDALKTVAHRFCDLLSLFQSQPGSRLRLEGMNFCAVIAGEEARVQHPG